MVRCIKYPSINQWRNLVKDISDRACYVGADEEGNAIFDYLKPKPNLTFEITEKVHGTNAGVSYSNPDGIWYQSRENVITVEKDNAGFAFFCEQRKEVIIKIINDLADDYEIDLNTNIITLYGEFAGGNIQKNSALTNCEKSFILFRYFKVSPIEPNEYISAKWYETTVAGGQRIFTVAATQYNIYNIRDYFYKTIEINFNQPERYINELIEIMQKIEEASPIGQSFGQEKNIGEGIVISYLSEDRSLMQAKIKGEAHSNTKVKTLKAVDTEKLDAIDKCIEAITHNWRFVQGLTEVFGPDYEKTLDRKRISEYLKWISSDTIKEESLIIADYGFEPKDVLGKVSQKAKEYFFAVENGITNG